MELEHTIALENASGKKPAYHDVGKTLPDSRPRAVRPRIDSTSG